MKLYSFQKQGVAFLKDKKYALLADDMGLGKTAQAIAATRDSGAANALVICPASVKYNWDREIDIWDPGSSRAIINRAYDLTIKGNHKYTIINYDLIHRADFAKILLKKSFDVLICDEAHYLKTSKTKRTRMVYSKRGLADNAGRVWLLTGTPVLNRPVEIYPMLRRFMPDRLGKFADYINFTRRFCEGRRTRFGWDDRGACNIEELAGLLDGFMLRRMKSEVLDQLPDKIYQKIMFDAPSTTVEQLLAKEKKQQTGMEFLGTFATLRRQLGIVKAPLVVKHVLNLLEEKEKIIIFAHHKDVIKHLKSALVGFRPVVLDGGLTPLQKQDAVDTFVKDHFCRVFIGQVDAAGIGIDGLQKVSDTVVFAEMPWVPGQIKQAIDRCHRIGQKNKVLIQFLMMKGGIDEDIYDAVAEKSKVVKKLIKVTEYNAVEREESMSIEQSLERIADALETMANKVSEISGPTKVAEKPVKAPAAPAAKLGKTPVVEPVATKGAFKSAKELLAYCNKQILSIEDKAKAKNTVQRVMAVIKENYGVATLAEIPADKLAEAKELFDGVIAGDDGADMIG